MRKTIASFLISVAVFAAATTTCFALEPAQNQTPQTKQTQQVPQTKPQPE
jgi:hypothetical protein